MSRVKRRFVGNVLALFVSKTGEKIKTVQEKIFLDNKGVLEDKFYGKGALRSVLLTSKESYQMVKKEGIEITYGALGENILMSYNPYHLPAGSKIQIADVILQISQNCTICNHLSVIDKKVPKILKNDRGVFAQVIQGGTISLDDKVYVLELS